MDESCSENSACYRELDACSNPIVRDTISELIDRRFSRRSAIKIAAVATGGLLGNSSFVEAAVRPSNPPGSPSTLTFRELPHVNDQSAHVADGYQLQVLLRWGDPVTSDAPAFDPANLTADAQRKQVGYNCDFTAFLPLPRNTQNSNRGLLCVNHEYTNTSLMFPGLARREDVVAMSKSMVDVEMAAHGHSVIEIERDADGRWRPITASPYNRRITALDTRIEISGPVRGHDRLKTSDDPTGTQVLGTLNNCAGGATPWGTMLIAEENFDGYFSGDAGKTAESDNHKRYGLMPESQFYPAWSRHYPRFNVEREPHEPNRFGWIVEFDPYDPTSVPVKRTALGRVKHEGAGIVVNGDGRVCVYCGDDERFDYVYKFVTNRRYVPNNPRANRDLLDDGTLYVARFSANGTLDWLPLVYGQGPLTAEHGFHSQADVLIETRRAADLLGATPMDRPEDVEPSPTTGRIYVILTNNTKRNPAQVDPANPRAHNAHGHIIELLPPGDDGRRDHTATRYQWTVLLRAGNPARPEDGAEYHAATSSDGWMSCPDNATFDQRGRMWVTTDNSADDKPFADGVYGCDVEGEGRALTRFLFAGPVGSEVSGVCLTPDDQTMFVSVQHPGELPESSFDKPATLWPDFQTGTPPRPSVVAIRRLGGGQIGS